MRIEISKGENDWIEKVWSWIHAQTQPGQRVFLPAGGTPAPAFARWAEQPSAHLKALKFVQIDDILTGPMQGYFRRFFETTLRPFQDQFEWIDTADQGADVAILGVGVNGHVAFHEPGLPAHFHSGCVRLSPETLSYLKLQESTWGITYGAGAFLRCRKILVLARGEHKKDVLQKAAKDKSMPIGWIMEHHDVTLISDFDF